MDLLLLLTSVLLSSCFHPGRVETAEPSFLIKDVTLSIEPGPDVDRDTNVTLRCRAVVSSSGAEPLSREYKIYKDGAVVHAKTSGTSEDVEHLLPEARVSDSGKYKCEINIQDKQRTSSAHKLTVTGLSKPVLRLNKGVISEGEETTAWCTAPGETGSIFFYFYEDSREIQERHVSSNQAEAKLRLSSVGIHKIHCAYKVLVTPDSFQSEDSNAVTVSVKELSIAPVLEIFPQNKIYEGDQLVIECSVSNLLYRPDGVRLYLNQGTRFLSSGDTKVNHTMVATATDPAEFECRLLTGNVEKVATKTLSVTELFSVPTLTMSPAEVFQKEYMTLTCRSRSVASERLRKEDLTFRLDPPQSALIPKGAGVFVGKALLYAFNYTCVAQAKGIVKRSDTLTVAPKVFASAPKISVDGIAVLGRPFDILCHSDVGSRPINYTLLRDTEVRGTASIRTPLQKALFTVTVTRPDDISKYMCKAKNSHREGLLSKRLNATVVVPLTNPTLTVIPDLPEISEGDHLYLICGIKGTPPVTFKWYRVGNEHPLNSTTSNSNNTDYQVPSLSKEHSGTYYCEAVNRANNVVRSDPVTIEVRLALWKKALIGGFCLLALAVLLAVGVLCFRSKRVRVDRAPVSVWTKRPPEDANDEESSVASNEPDVEYTEVVHPRAADPARVPLRQGTDTVYSELQNSPHGAADHHDYGSVEYAELNGEQPEVNHFHPEVNGYQDLPEPVD